VNENFNPGWQAVLNGQPLQPVRIDGWKQAWVLPAGTAGVVTLTYPPESVYRDAVLGGLVALALVILAALAVPRRRARPPLAWTARRPGPGQPWPGQPWPGPGQPRWRWLAAGLMIASLAVAGLLVGGYPGAIGVPAVAGVLCLLPPGRRAWSGPWRLLGGAFTVALAVGAVGEHFVLSGDSGPLATALTDTIPQLICLMVVGVLAAPLLRGTLERDE
jgi:arabinofuranan 3-O-arabinosyltransferase